MVRRNALVAFNKQVRQLPDDLQERECGLIELGRMYARNFDEGHNPSGGAVQRVLGELRRLAANDEKRATKRELEAAALAVEAERQAPSRRNELDELRARRAQRVADS